MNAAAAQTLALRALAYVAQDPEALGGFLAQSGVGPDELRARARDPHLLAGVLDFLAADEARAKAFCEQEKLAPGVLMSARRRLPGGDTLDG